MNSGLKHTHYVPILNLFRAIASLGVCAVHMHYDAGLPTNSLSRIISYGQLGVPVFFIISGFVIPYSLWNSGYTMKSFFPYILKRYIRIDPPYIAIILICILAGYQFDLLKFIYHLLYIIPFTNHEWYQGVFWTLGVEFQFYIIIGLCFSMIRKSNVYILLAILLILSSVGYFIPLKNSYNFIFHNIHYFVYGIIILLQRKKRISTIVAHLSLIILTVYLCLSISIITGLIGLIVSLCIIYLDFQTKTTNFLSTISYSLYLTHVLTGQLIITLLKPFSLNSYLLYFIVLAACILSATIFYYLIERAALKWSKSIRTYPVKTAIITS